MDQSYLFLHESEEGEEEDTFFDSREDISSQSSSCPDSPLKQDLILDRNYSFSVSSNPLYQIWFKNPESIQQRRSKFNQLMGLLDPNPNPITECELTEPESTTTHGEINSSDDKSNLSDTETDRDTDGHTIDERTVSSEPSSAQSSLSRWSTDQPSSSRSATSDGTVSDACLDWLFIKNLDSGTVFVIDELARDGSVRSLHELGSDRTVTAAEFDRSFGSSPFIRTLMRKDDGSSVNLKKIAKKEKISWLRRLGIKAHIIDKHGNKIDPDLSISDPSHEGKIINRVKVRIYKKHHKDLSAVYRWQDFTAHNGAILTVKFSFDGLYLASGGEDSVVRVWCVNECERTGDYELNGDDPSCIYFRWNENCELVPVNSSNYNDRQDKHGILKRNSDLVCVVIPQRVFRIEEEPVHEFLGHNGDVLDLSWSKLKYLLSSSADKTVRLWQVGCNSCLKVFSHTDFVTCVQFNPVNEDYFISGSIDGKVRIWEIPSCHVVDWKPSKEIITAVCYHPDGKKVVVGTITGQCRFYDASDNHLELKDQISLLGKKKSSFKRITSFQFCPNNPTKLLVASDDSQIRILDGIQVVSKYRGVKSHSSHVTASFTPDGQHVISCTDDSNIYFFNMATQAATDLYHIKDSYSSERFLCENASIAIPWTSSHAPCPFNTYMQDNSNLVPKGPTATWPEEALPPGSVSKSQYKILRSSCQNGTDAWGQVVVTAGWDGRIRSFQNYGLPVLL